MTFLKEKKDKEKSLLNSTSIDMPLYQEVEIKRLFFKAARVDKVDLFLAMFERLENNPVALSQFVMKKDPERRNLLVLCLQNSSIGVLREIREKLKHTIDVDEYILKQEYDTYHSLQIALGLSYFKQFRDRSLETAQFLVDLITERTAKLQKMKEDLKEGEDGPLPPTDLTLYCQQQDRLGRTSLHVACAWVKKYPESVDDIMSSLDFQSSVAFPFINSLITECKINPAIQDMEGYTALHYLADNDSGVLL